MPTVPRRRLSDILGGGEEAVPPEDTAAAAAPVGLPPGATPGAGGGVGLGPGVGQALEGVGAVGGADQDQLEIDALEAALADPNTPPEERALIQARLAQAARRQLAGVPGAGGGIGGTL